MELSSSIGVAVIGIVLGLAGRLIGPRPTVRQAICCALAGLVGGELGVLLGAQSSHGTFQWVIGIILAALFVGVCVGWFVWRSGPYPPHSAVMPDPHATGERPEGGDDRHSDR
jgi:hypothetical protein